MNGNCSMNLAVWVFDLPSFCFAGFIVGRAFNPSHGFALYILVPAHNASRAQFCFHALSRAKASGASPSWPSTAQRSRSNHKANVSHFGMVGAFWSVSLLSELVYHNYNVCKYLKPSLSVSY